MKANAGKSGTAGTSASGIGSAASRGGAAAVSGRSVAPGRREVEAEGPLMGQREARVLWTGLAALAIARAVVVFVPTMALWGLDAQRFIAAPAAWLPWALAALALIPRCARVMTPPLEAFGRAIDKAPRRTSLAAFALVGVLVALFPDRLHYVGDSLLRIGAVGGEESPNVLSPQAFPLDVLLYYSAPLRAERVGWMSAEALARAIGALGAGLLAALAVVFARALDVPPAARAAAFFVATCGGYLCLFTGEMKAFAEMVCAVVGLAAFGLAVLRALAAAGRDSTRGGTPGAGAMLGAGLCLGLGVLFHRFAIGLVPAWLLVTVLWLRACGSRVLRSPTALAALAAPLTVLVVMGPRVVRTVATYDIGVNFATTANGVAGGLKDAVFGPSHLADVLNLLLFLSPLALIALALVLVRERRPSASPAPHPWPRAGAALIATLVLPFVFVMLLARPPQGLLRDWDSFATPAAALSVGAAWVVAQTLGRSRQAWLAAAVALAVAAPCFQWLEHFSDAPRALARLEALMAGPPMRPATDRAPTWNVIGWRYFDDGNYAKAAQAFEQAAAAAPSPSNLTQWAMAETMRGDRARAFALYGKAVERDSNFTMGWIGFGVSAINTDRPADAARAARALARLAPTHPRTLEIAEWVGRH